MLTLAEKGWIALYMLPFLVAALSWMMWKEGKE